MPTRTRIVAGSVVATLGFLGIVVGALGTALDWGAETTGEAVADETGDTGQDDDQAAETPEEFLAALAVAVQEGDAVFQRDRLHPAVIERYGEAACRADIATRTDPTRAFEVTQVRDEPEDFDYASDGQSETIPDTVVVDAQVTVQGATSAQSVHLVEIDGEFRYFTDCGMPASAGEPA